MITATLVGSFIDAMVNDILPKRGITFNTNNTGISMEPTIKAGALFVMDEQFPFSDLKVGDIITFRPPTDFGNTRDYYNNTSRQIEVRGIIIQPGESVHIPQRAKDEGIEYKDDYNVLHRIVDIRPADAEHDLAFFTQGDNSEHMDTTVVMKSGYIGKVIWHANNGRKIYDRFNLMWIGIILFGALLFVPGSLIPQYLDEKREKESGKNQEAIK